MWLRRWFGGALTPLGGALLAACAAAPISQIQSNFSTLFECDESQVKVDAADGGYEASGCQRVAFYRCEQGNCRLGTPGDGAVVSDGARVNELRLTVQLENAKLFLSSVPEVGEQGELAVSGDFVDNCELDVMIDGQRVSLPAGSRATSRSLSRDFMRDLGVAQQVALRACKERWSLDERQLAQVHQYVGKYEEALAWQDKPREGASGGRRPPAGGWPAWSSLSQLPVAATSGAALTGPQLFEKLAPSVLRVEAPHEGGMSMGSAVAVTAALALTNCHVVEAAARITVKQRKSEWSARLVHSDPKKDRCVLEVTPATLTPVGGVRAYADLKVGEPLYTLGAPSGLDLSLADGILSGLREEEGVKFVQTTAPISPGSSGGGLFDSQGNLVGITTGILAGKEKLNQSLNFAIAAELFWNP